jgi:hypothetical protein
LLFVAGFSLAFAGFWPASTFLHGQVWQTFATLIVVVVVVVVCACDFFLFLAAPHWAKVCTRVHVGVRTSKGGGHQEARKSQNVGAVCFFAF